MPAAGERSRAKARGDQHYETGKPCKNGHVAKRLTSTGQCVECVSAWFKANADHRRAYINEWQQTPEHKAYMKAYYEANKGNWHKPTPDQIRSRSKAYREKYPEKHYAAIKRWHKANPEKVRAYQVNNKAKRKGAPGKHTGEDIVELFNAQIGLCIYCGVDLLDAGYHVDHDVPLTRGGSNDPENLVLTCPRCNQSKQALTGGEFRARRREVA